MIRHIVMISFNNRERWTEYAEEASSMLMSLEIHIPELIRMQTGINFSTRETAHDMVLIADFDDESGLNIYRDHPRHLDVLNYLAPIVKKTSVVDFKL